MKKNAKNGTLQSGVYRVVLFFFALALPSAAQLSNLSEVVDGSDRASINQWLATAIILDDGASPVLIKSVTLKTRVLVPNDFVHLSISGDSFSRPNLTVTPAIFDVSGLGSAEPQALSSEQTFAAVLDENNQLPMLMPGSTYWIVFGVSEADYGKDLPSGLFEWDFTNASAQLPAIDGLRVGTQVATSNTFGQEWTSFNAPAQLFGIDFVVVPEPSAWTLLCLAGCSLLSRRSRS